MDPGIGSKKHKKCSWTRVVRDLRRREFGSNSKHTPPWNPPVFMLRAAAAAATTIVALRCFHPTVCPVTAMYMCILAGVVEWYAFLP
jgi:hypothetical protein